MIIYDSFQKSWQNPKIYEKLWNYDEWGPCNTYSYERTGLIHEQCYTWKDLIADHLCDTDVLRQPEKFIYC